MGDVIVFPRQPKKRPELQITEADIARYASLIARGYDEDYAMEIVAVAHRMMACSSG